MERRDESPAAADLARAREDYENTRKPVAEIAASLGMTMFTLVSLAKLEGWKLRTARPSKKTETARQTIVRLRALLQSRVAELESRIGEIGEDAANATSEREIRAMNILVRTLEKVLELERKDRNERIRAGKQRRIVDDARREELARKIEALQAGRRAS